MKNLGSSVILGAIVGLISLSNVAAQIAASTHAAANAAGPVSKGNATVQLSHGASEVLKLTHAQLGDDAIIAYVANSGETYDLSASELVYLKGQGVSDAVLTAMLQHHQSPATGIVWTPQPQASTSPSSAQAPEQGHATQSAITQTQSSSTQVAPEYVTTPAATTTYVVSSPPPTYYYAYPTYPAVSFSFGFGGWYGGPYHGCHYGYWHH